jgi:hypothetical protein
LAAIDLQLDVFSAFEPGGHSRKDQILLTAAIALTEFEVMMSRSDKTAIELFLAGVQSWNAGMRQILLAFGWRGSIITTCNNRFSEQSSAHRLVHRHILIALSHGGT